jgi:hypothetical protein
LHGRPGGEALGRQLVEALVALMIVAAYLLVLTRGAGVLRELF